MLGLVLGSNEAMCVSYLLSVKFCQVKGKTYKLQLQSMTQKKKKNDTRYNWITYQNCSLGSSKSAFRIEPVLPGPDPGVSGAGSPDLGCGQRQRGDVLLQPCVLPGLHVLLAVCRL